MLNHCHCLCTKQNLAAQLESNYRKNKYDIYSGLLALVLEEPKIQTIRNRNRRGAVTPADHCIVLDGIPHMDISTLEKRYYRCV